MKKGIYSASSSFIFTQLILILACLSLWRPCIAAQCSEAILTPIFEALKQKAGADDWYDINPIDPFNQTCEFTVRYYPCNKEIDEPLRMAITEAAKGCRMQYPGTHVQIEGYCAINNVKLNCAYGVLSPAHPKSPLF